MHAHRKEVLCAGLLVEAHQVVRVPLFGFPVSDQVFVADFGRVAVGFAMIEILFRTLDVHVTGVPVAIFNGRLRSPVGPDAELRIAKPLRNLVGLKRLPGCLEGLIPGRCLADCETGEGKRGTGFAHGFQQFTPVDCHCIFSFLTAARALRTKRGGDQALNSDPMQALHRSRLLLCRISRRPSVHKRRRRGGAGICG